MTSHSTPCTTSTSAAEGHGKFVWTSGGVDYLKQYLPPSMRDLESTPESIIAQMDYAGVDRAVIQSGHLYGRLNDYIAEAVRRYPDRFWGLALVDEWKADDPSEMRSLEMAHRRVRPPRPLVQHRLAGDAPPRHTRRRPRVLPILGPRSSPQHPRLLERHDCGARSGRLPIPARVLQPLAEHLPDIPCVLTHGLTVARFMDNGITKVPDAAVDAIDAPNVISELLFPIFQGAVFDYPYRELQPIIRNTTNAWAPTTSAGAPTSPTSSATPPTAKASYTSATTATSSPNTT